MIEFETTISDSQAKSFYLNLGKQGHAFQLPHKSHIWICDGKGRYSPAQMHHATQVWGMLKCWYLDNRVETGNRVHIRFNPEERHEGQHVLHLIPDSSAPILLALQAARTFKGGGESAEQQKLKTFVASRPGLLSLPSECRGELEYPLPSGDIVDVLFKTEKCWVGAEVKSRISDQADVVRGLFQCIKYDAVIKAYQAAMNLPLQTRTVLILENSLPRELADLRDILKVEVAESVNPNDP